MKWSFQHAFISIQKPPVNFMSVNKFLIIICFLFLGSSCSIKNYSPTKKLSKENLQNDFSLLIKILEEKHPSLYWYTSKDSMDLYFNRYFNEIKDSMTDQDFAWKIISPLLNKIKCGHTSVSMTKKYYKWEKQQKFKSFPYHLKIWADSMAVSRQQSLRDTFFKRGTIIKSINGLNVDMLKNRVFDCFPQDGNSTNVSYVRLSSNFPYYFRNVFGNFNNYEVNYIDSSGKNSVVVISEYNPASDTLKKVSAIKIKQVPVSKFQKLEESRSFEIDSTGAFAIMRLNTFSKGRLRAFFRESFKQLRQNHIPNLILDIRINGGGRVSTSTLLTKYLSNTSFKVADSVYSKTNTLSPYTKYFKNKFINNLQFLFIVRKHKDSLFHLNRYESKYYNIKKRNHFNGKTYVLINGPTFSASCLFANAIKGQKGITLVGEETGGGVYGNNGMMIPDLKLPYSKLRVRIPLFRIVQFHHVKEKGSGIMPDIYVPTNYEALVKGYDKKMTLVKQLIFQSVKK